MGRRRESGLLMAPGDAGGEVRESVNQQEDHDCPFKHERTTLFNPNYNCCDLGAWVRPSVVEYDKPWFLFWSKRRDLVFSPVLVDYLKPMAMLRERDNALGLSLLTAARNKTISALGIHPTWITPIFPGSISMAMQVGPMEKRAKELQKPLIKGKLPGNWTLRSTHKPLERLVENNSRLGMSRVRSNQFVRKWIFGQSPELPRIG